jgi:hypothetical protein
MGFTSAKHEFELIITSSASTTALFDEDNSHGQDKDK